MSIGWPSNWRVVFLRFLVSFATITGVLAGQFFTIFPAQAAKPVAPKVGNCYSLNLSELNAAVSSKKTVACSSAHTAETYRVVQWQGPVNPASLNELRRRPIAEKACRPWNQDSKIFNNWSYKVPTAIEWRNGSRSIRCDAYALREENINQPVIFRGKQLDFN